MEKTLLLGISKGKILTGDFEITTRNEYKEFNACFNVGNIFDIDVIDNNYYETWFDNYWECCDNETKLELLENGEITYNRAFKNWKNSVIDYRDVVDCSCTDYEIEIKENTYNFESIAGGQCDIRKEKNIIYTNEKIVNKLLYMWDNYHLKEVNEEIEKNIIDLLNAMSKFEECEDEFYDFIKKNIEL